MIVKARRATNWAAILLMASGLQAACGVCPTVGCGENLHFTGTELADWIGSETFTMECGLRNAASLRQVDALGPVADGRLVWPTSGCNPSTEGPDRLLRHFHTEGRIATSAVDPSSVAGHHRPLSDSALLWRRMVDVDLPGGPGTGSPDQSNVTVYISAPQGWYFDARFAASGQRPNTTSVAFR